MASESLTRGGLTSKATYSYGPGTVVTQKQDFDFGQASPSRTTITNYQGFAATPLYLSQPSILDRPCQTVVYDANNNRVAETDYFYDNGGTGTVCGTAGTPSVSSAGGSSLTGHDGSNYSASSTGPRGDVTQIKRWLNTGAFPVTTLTYDETGQVTSRTDPCGNPNGSCSDMIGATHITNYYYADNYSNGTPPGITNAYLTSMTDPLGHSSSFAYSYSDGQLTRSTDANTRVTNYKYNTPPSGCSSSDGLDRLSEIDHPDGGTTTYCYKDTPPVSVTKNTLLASGINKVDVSVLDGLGHVKQTQLTSDPDGTDITDTTYDGLGRVLTQSNPHRSVSSSSDGTTAYTYDALGRVCVVGQADGTAAPASCPSTAPAGDVFAAYSGNCSTVTDERGKSRKSCSDGLGRLTQVFEDPANLNYETDYAYDALDNLRQVNQKGDGSAPRVRNFTYDSLSRLTQASNPESGTISYGYDNNSNLQSRVDARNITATYGYDALNRLTGKSYNDGLTAAVKFGYDGVALAGCTPGPPSLADSNPVGNRTAMCDGSGATSWSHDAVGRVATESRTIHGATNLTKSITYGYNLDGSLASLTYPSGRIVAYDVRGAGRPISAIESANSITYSTGATYTPAGALSGVQLGGTFGRWSYNNRLQPLQIYATNGAVADASQLQATVCPSTAATLMSRIYNFNPGQDNGNVVSIADCLVSARSQNFDYDNLNRLADGYSAGSTGSSIPGNWGENYTIDAWGNLTNIATKPGRGHGELLNCATANVRNELNTCYGYDAAGNLTSNGSTMYAYDAENRLKSTSGNSYVYDGDGKRVINCVGGYPSCTTATLYRTGAGSDTISETSWTGAQVQEYTFFNGRRIARRYSSANTVKYMFADHLGTNDLLLDSTGVIERASFYYPFGGEVLVSGSGTNSYKFTGKERDVESGLDYFGARHYASAMGRFMTPDWSSMATAVPYADFGNPQSLNLYSHTKNNPTTLTDPNGHCDVDGEHHWGWCLWHDLGFYQTQHDLAEGARFTWNYYAQNGLVYYRNGKPVDWSKLSDKDAIQAAVEANDALQTGQVVTMSPAAAASLTQWGWQGQQSYNEAKNLLNEPNTSQGTVDRRDLLGKIPTKDEAVRMIEDVGGKVERIEGGHSPGGVSPHENPHINYTTASGAKGTIDIQQ